MGEAWEQVYRYGQSCVKTMVSVALQGVKYVYGLGFFLPLKGDDFIETSRAWAFLRKGKRSLI